MADQSPQPQTQPKPRNTRGRYRRRRGSGRDTNNPNTDSKGSESKTPSKSAQPSRNRAGESSIDALPEAQTTFNTDSKGSESKAPSKTTQPSRNSSGESSIDALPEAQTTSNTNATSLSNSHQNRQFPRRRSRKKNNHRENVQVDVEQPPQHQRKGKNIQQSQGNNMPLGSRVNTLNACSPEFVPGSDFVSPSIAGPSSSSSEAPPISKRSNPRKAKSRRSRIKRTTPLPSISENRTEQMHQDITNGIYQCVICLDPITPKTPIWSQCHACRTAFHHRCIKEWQDSKLVDPMHADEGWKCASCNTHMDHNVELPVCWCGKTNNPRQIPGMPPHSCGEQCLRERENCQHRCTEICHAAQCPPCPHMGYTLTCDCGREHKMLRCGEKRPNSFRCEAICEKLLNCGEHKCEDICHKEGQCQPCDKLIPAICFCGKAQKEIICGSQVKVSANINYGQVSVGGLIEVEKGAEFLGAWDCGKVCNQLLDCGLHVCEATCHSGNCPIPHCPLSPDVVKTCPCGKVNLSNLTTTVRQSCQEPISTCGNVCGKSLSCGHRCMKDCHEGSCNECSVLVDVKCRCKRQRYTLPCPESQGEHTCERVCKARMSCVRHTCQLQCCAALNPIWLNQTRSINRMHLNNQFFDAAHICLRVCGKKKNCGIHDCQEGCHSGPCNTCQEFTNDDISCPCGFTTRYAPVPCGYKIRCERPCHRTPTCGHPYVAHPCHGDDSSCIKCPYLVQKECMCGKEIMKNVPCGGRTPSCGLPCGKMLACGKHFCKKLCHQGECEVMNDGDPSCDQLCGGFRNICGHACTSKCHGTRDCPQERSCQEKIQQACACGHRKREIKCLAKFSDSIPNREPLECDNECLRFLRLQSIAEALGVDPERSDAGKDDYVYSDTTLDMFEQRTGWCGSQENEIRTFAVSQESRLLFKPMGRPSRTFIHMLAADLGLKSESQDPEPNRAVMVYKRDGRLPILPKLTLLEASRARAEKFRAQLAEKQSEALTVTGSHSKGTPQPSKLPKFFNTIVVKNVPFGMTLDELENHLTEALTSNPDLIFTSHFSENSSAYFRATHRSGMAPSSLQHLVTRIKNVAARVMDRHDPTATVCMCTSDENFVVTHWDKETSIDGWEHVGGRQRPLGNRSARDQSMAAVAAAAVMNNKNQADATAGSSSRSSKTLVLRRKVAPPNRFANRFIINEDDGDNEAGHDATPNSTIPEEQTARLQAEDHNEGRTIVGQLGEYDERRSSGESLRSTDNNIETEQPPLRRLEPSPYENIRRFSSSIDDW